MGPKGRLETGIKFDPPPSVSCAGSVPADLAQTSGDSGTSTGVNTGLWDDLLLLTAVSFGLDYSIK